MSLSSHAFPGLELLDCSKRFNLSLSWRHLSKSVQETKVSVPESRSFRFPKSRSKYLDDAVKLAKTLPGFEKTKKHYKVTFSKTDSGSDDLWELLKIASRWKGAVFLFDGKEVDQEAWESSFHQAAADSGDEGEKAAVIEAPEKAEEAKPAAKEPPKAEEPKPEVEEPAKAAEKKPEPQEPPKVEEKKPEPKEPPKVEEKKSEPKEPPKVEEKKPEPKESPKAEEKKPASKPVTVQINPAPKPEDNSGCGKSAAVLMIAALGLLQFFR